MPEIDISMIYVIMKPIFDNVMHRNVGNANYLLEFIYIIKKS